MASWHGWRVSALKMLDSRLWFLTQTVLLPHFITKVVFKPRIFGSYVLTVTAWALAFLGLRIFYALVLYPKWFTPFRHLPTPKKRTLLWGNMEPQFGQPAGLTLRRFAQTIPNNGLIRYYGFLSQERILITSTKGFKEVFVHMGYEFTKTFPMKFAISRFTGEGLGYSEGDEHRHQRKNLMPAFSYRHIKNLYPTFWSKGVEMVELIQQELENKTLDEDKTVVIRGWASRVTLDIIGVTGMDRDFETLRDPNNELNKVYRKLFVPPSNNMRIFSQLGYFVSPTVLQRLPLPRNKTLAECQDYLRNVIRQMILQKKETMKSSPEHKQTDIIGVALQSGAFAEENLVDQMMTFIAAGHETTASALQWLVCVLSKRQDIQSRLREEIRSSLPSIARDATGKLTIPDAALVDSLPYLSAVCSEILRFYPPVSFTFREALRDAVVCDTFIPKSTITTIAADVTNHDTSLWGPDAGVFDPERWLKPGNTNSGGATSNYAMMTFIHGPRSCIGNHFSKSELLCVAAVLVGRFKMELAEPDLEVEVNVGITVVPKDGVRVKLEPLDGW